MKRTLAIVLGLACCLAGARAARAQAPTTLKVATLAPEGSSWMVLFHEFAKNLEQHTSGRLKVKFFAGAVAGDERDYVRKMRLGQLNGAAVTSIGLGLIQSEVRVLELPMLIQSYDELDYVRDKLDDDLRKKFEDKGYVLLGWGDVGPVHIFTNNPIRSRNDLVQTKMWAWVDDALVRELFRQLGINGVPLGVPDVLPSLQTGLINACYGSPYSTMALQWYTKLKYVTKLHITQAIGATVLTKRDFDKLPADVQKTILSDARDFQAKLLKKIRDENTKAMDAIKKAGLQVIDTPPELVAEFEKQSLAVRGKLEPTVYSHEWRTKVEKLVADYRASKK